MAAGDERDLHAEMMHLTLGIAAKALLDADVSGREFDASPGPSMC